MILYNTQPEFNSISFAMVTEMHMHIEGLDDFRYSGTITFWSGYDDYIQREPSVATLDFNDIPFIASLDASTQTISIDPEFMATLLGEIEAQDPEISFVNTPIENWKTFKQL